MNVTLLRGLCAVSLLAMSAGISAQDADESALDALDKAAPVVQPVREPPGAVELRSAMRRIAQYPNDAEALADAGNASLMLGDANAALNFLTRANALRPNNGRIVSGLAAATVRTENPFEALRLFDDAVRLGVSERSIAADRALAFDLLGNFARAQQDYKLARTANMSEDLVIRQAISLSLSGEKNESDAMLVPLLQKNSPAAWRARAFMLAARGDFRESTKVTQGFMDASSAQRMERYLRLMPDLTGAQQAAAIHLGHFPASHDVGRDSEQVRRVASTIPPVEPSKNESRLIPTGAPLGPKPAKDEKKPKTRDAKIKNDPPVKVAAANIPDAIKLPKTDTSRQTDPVRLSTDSARAKVQEAQAAKVVTVTSSNGLPPPESARPLVNVGGPQAAGTPTQLPPSQPPPANIGAALPSGTGSTLPPVVQTQPLPQPISTAPAVTNVPPVKIAAAPPIAASAATSPAITSGTAVQGPTLSGAPVAQAAQNAAPLPPPAETPPATAVVIAPVELPASSAKTVFDLAAIVGSIEIPESEQKPSAVPVDLKKLKATPPKTATAEAVKAGKVDPKAAAKTTGPANPARFWVQIATGEPAALTYDYRRWAKKSPDLFKGRDGWTSAWGKTSRLLVGPFDDLKTSKKWEADFRKAGGNGFGWKSENGVVVVSLKGK